MKPRLKTTIKIAVTNYQGNVLKIWSSGYQKEEQDLSRESPASWSMSPGFRKSFLYSVLSHQLSEVCANHLKA